MSRIEPKPLKNYPWYLRLIFFWQKKRYGSPIKPSLIWGRRPKLLSAFNHFFRAIESADSLLSPALRSRVMLRVSEINECPFCVDMNKYLLSKRQEPIPQEMEKCALDYVEAITKCEKPSEELFKRLKLYFSDDAIVELTGVITFQNLSSQFNTVLEIEPFGFCSRSIP